MSTGRATKEHLNIRALRWYQVRGCSVGVGQGKRCNDKPDPDSFVMHAFRGCCPAIR